ncbi:hypothetical protein, partial [Microbulbifer sp. TYP-18]|uniref:hypothetical protein n=1 Tax=Microbulbifer sp. TYP-18 TaxID=3230024 RepID=UPI0034C63A67
VVGGTTSELSGGKFANGAITAAMQYVMNWQGGGESAQKGGKINLFSKKDVLLYGAAEAKFDDPNTLDIWGHGTASYMNGLSSDGSNYDANGNPIVLDAKALSELVLNSGQWSPGMPIRLRGCNTGNLDALANPLAMELSGILNTTVSGASWYYHTNAIDSFSVGPKYFPIFAFGTWNEFSNGVHVGSNNGFDIRVYKKNNP